MSCREGTDAAFSSVDPVLITRAVALLRQGSVVAYPTETSYGLGAAVDRPAALDRIFVIKQRPRHKPLLVLIADPKDLDGLVSHIPSVAKELMRRFWPGPLTLLLPARPEIPWPLRGDTEKVGIRISSHPWAQALLKELNAPLTATSANVSGRQPARTATEVWYNLGDNGPDWVLDGGSTPGGPPSTIVDVSTETPRLVRVGAIEPSALGL